MKDKLLVVPKHNQLPLHYDKYDIDYLVELVPGPENKNIKVMCVFPPGHKLTSAQQNEIIKATELDLQYIIDEE